MSKPAKENAPNSFITQLDEIQQLSESLLLYRDANSLIESKHPKFANKCHSFGIFKHIPPGIKSVQNLNKLPQIRSIYSPIPPIMKKENQNELGLLISQFNSFENQLEFTTLIPNIEKTQIAINILKKLVEKYNGIYQQELDKIWEQLRVSIFKVQVLDNNNINKETYSSLYYLQDNLIFNLKNETFEFKSKIERLEKENEALSSESNKLKKKYVSMEKEYLTMKEELEEREKHIGILESYVIDSQHECEELRTIIGANTVQLELSSRQINELSKTHPDMETINLKLFETNSLNQTLEIEVEQLKSEVAALKEMKRSASQEIKESTILNPTTTISLASTTSISGNNNATITEPTA